jgi:hypothetical protein
MSRRARWIAVVVVLALVLGLVYDRMRSAPAPLPDHPGSAQRVVVVTPRPSGGSDAPFARPQTPEQRKALLAAIRTAHAKRLAGSGSAAATTPSPRGSAATSGRAPGQPLDIVDNTGDPSPWQKRALATLNDVLGQCLDIAQSEQPGLEGNLTVRFTISAEPEVGGLVEDVGLDEEHSSIQQPSLRECVQQSLYALEIDPPDSGLRVSREISLRVP